MIFFHSSAYCSAVFINNTIGLQKKRLIKEFYEYKYVNIAVCF